MDLKTTNNLIDEFWKWFGQNDGVEDYFDIVQKIIDNAPLIKNGKLIAFRQPYDKEKLQKFVLTVYGYSLYP